MNKYKYDWKLSEANFTKNKGTVFSCFACGGGSTMGYKLAGFNVIGCNEIDPKMAAAYQANHDPKYCFIEPIQDFKNREDLPPELFNLDILDGSPPCSSFSMVGNRAKDWGENKKFREGQAEQILDRLFFDFIDLAKRLQPKIVIAENVKGLLLGDAQKYVNEILIAFDSAGYYVDFKLLNAAVMGVPQNRERVFFYAIRKDLYSGPFADLFQTRPVLDLEFNFELIPFSCIEDGTDLTEAKKTKSSDLWELVEEGKLFSTAHPKGHFFSSWRVSRNKPIPTIVSSSGAQSWHYNIKRELNKNELLKGATFPMDYDFINSVPKYIMGMSVPPVMVANIADRIYKQWLNV